MTIKNEALGSVQMSLISENSTRFFTVVGAAFLPKRHFDSYGNDGERLASRHFEFGVDTLSRSGSSNWWLHDGR